MNKNGVLLTQCLILTVFLNLCQLQFFRWLFYYIWMNNHCLLKFRRSYRKQINLWFFFKHFYITIKINIVGNSKTRSCNITLNCTSRTNFYTIFSVNFTFNIARNNKRIYFNTFYFTNRVFCNFKISIWCIDFSSKFSCNN